MSWLFNDRQFLCRGVGVAFPDGTRALAVYSPPDGTYPGDPGVTKSRTIRAHMGVSGYVVSPYAGEERSYLGQDRCQITMVLQVDPRVSLLAACNARQATLGTHQQQRVYTTSQHPNWL
jgi:hypothetical protein